MKDQTKKKDEINYLLIVLLALSIFITYKMHTETMNAVREAGQWEQYTQDLRAENMELQDNLNDTLHDNLELQIQLYGSRGQR